MGEEIKQKSIIKAFLDVGLLYAEKHYNYLRTPTQVYSTFFATLLASQKHSVGHWLNYKWWVLANGLHITDMNVNTTRDPASRWYDAKEYSNWDLDLYGNEYGKRTDPGKVGWAVITPGTKDQLLWYPAGWGKQTPVFRYLFAPFWVPASYLMNYPQGYMHLPQKYVDEGRDEFPPTLNIHKNLMNRKFDDCSLPQHNAEVKLGLNTLEYDRALMKAAFMLDHPQLYKTPIKWRYVRRHFRDLS